MKKETSARERAATAFLRKKPRISRKELRAAADRQDKNGGDSVGIPAREMLADMLLEAKRTADALAEYKVVLKNAPNRFDALLGAGRAAQASGDPVRAQTFYAKLRQMSSAGADRSELAEAKTVLARR